MNSGANGKQPLNADSDVNGHVRNGCLQDGDRCKVATQPVSHGAWVTTNSNYDWMDSHAPFVSLD